MKGHCGLACGIRSTLRYNQVIHIKLRKEQTKISTRANYFESERTR